MRAGTLRHRVDLERNDGTQDAFGAVDDDWFLVSTMWASVEPLSGRELIAAQQVQATVTHRIRIRYLADVVPKMRVSYGDRHFDVLSVINTNERNRELELMCRELV